MSPVEARPDLRIQSDAVAFGPTVAEDKGAKGSERKPQIELVSDRLSAVFPSFAVLTFPKQTRAFLNQRF